MVAPSHRYFFSWLVLSGGADAAAAKSAFLFCSGSVSSAALSCSGGARVFLIAETIEASEERDFAGWVVSVRISETAAPFKGEILGIAGAEGAAGGPGFGVGVAGGDGGGGC